MPAPAVDITEDDKAYKMTAELPGTSEKEIEVLISGDTLTLEGEKRQEKEQKDKNLYLSERSYGAFQRTFYVPDGVDRDKISADFSKGVLSITVPKTAKATRSCCISASSRISGRAANGGPDPRDTSRGSRESLLSLVRSPFRSHRTRRRRVTALQAR